MTSLTQAIDKRMGSAREPGAARSTGQGGESAERLRVQRQRMRSIAIGVSLALLVALFYAATIVRLGGNVFNRPY